MSFSYELKQELALLPLQNESCYLSELSALIRTSAEIKIEKAKFLVILKTEIAELYEKVNAILETLYGFSVELTTCEDDNLLHNIRYEIKIDADHATKVLEDCGIIFFDEEHNTLFSGGIDKYLVMDIDEKKSYIRGAFIGCGTSSIVITESGEEHKRSNVGYHLEFVFSNDELALDFSALLSEFDILSKKVERKHNYVVYLKEAEYISDLIVLMGATKNVLKLNNELVLRSLRNAVNRQNNCETGNITKVVNASVKQMNAIRIIQETIGIESLPLSLQETAMLRLANPEESLEELVLLSQNSVTKSGVNHRFRKLISIANTLSQK